MRLSEATPSQLDLANFTQVLQNAFNYYGFVSHPLTVAQLHLCHAEGFSENTTYNLACDWQGGFFETLQEAITYYHT